MKVKMSGFSVLLKKELKEQLRTHKLLIAVVVFLLFGLGTPLLIKYTPQLIELAGEDLVKAALERRPKFSSTARYNGCTYWSTTK